MAAAATRRTTRLGSRPTKNVVAALAGALVLVAMFLSTKVVSPTEEAKLNPPPFNAATYAAAEFPKHATDIAAKAVDIATLIPAVSADAKAAGTQYGTDSGSGNYTFPVKATATVTSVDENFITLESPVKGAKVLIPRGVALSGTPVRDALGDITFGDFVDQTDFQQVANEFKLLMEKNVLGKVDAAGLQGKTVSVVGAWSTGGAADTYIIQPVTLEVQ